MNSRTADYDDFITDDSVHSSLQDRLNNLFTYTNDLCLSKRMNPDKSRNEYGFKLLKLCKSTGLRILNGRHGSGFANDYTYCGATSLSVIDYLISTIDLFNYVDKFIISNFNEYSDHASLHVEFLVRNVSENSNTSKVNDDNKGDSRKLFRWNDEYKLQCREELTSNVDQLNLLCENLNFESQENLDNSVYDFSVFLNSIMAPFFEVKHDSVKNGKPKIYNKPRNDDKPWFTDECKRLYRNYMRCLNIFNHEKSSVNHSNLIEAKKIYKKLESRLKRIYKRQQGNMLEGLRTINPKLFYGKFAKKRRITPKVSGNEF